MTRTFSQYSQVASKVNRMLTLVYKNFLSAVNSKYHFLIEVCFHHIWNTSLGIDRYSHCSNDIVKSEVFLRKVTNGIQSSANKSYKTDCIKSVFFKETPQTEEIDKITQRS